LPEGKSVIMGVVLSRGEGLGEIKANIKKCIRQLLKHQ